MEENINNIIWNSNDKFPKINFISNIHSQKDTKFNKTKKIIESTCKTLKVNAKQEMHF